MSLKRSIVDNYSTLLRSIEPSDQLFASLSTVELIAGGIQGITSGQIRTDHDKVSMLLSELQKVAGEQQDLVMNCLVSALKDSYQQHVANIFRKESEDIPMTDEHYQILSGKRSQLQQFLEPRYGLLEELYSSGVFDDANYARVRVAPNIAEKALETVSILQRKSDESFDKFVTALNNSNQEHVAYILTGVGLPPMSVAHLDLIRSKTPELCEFMDVETEGSLVEKLLSVRVINDMESSRIRSKQGNNAMGRELLETLRRKCDDAYFKFIQSLTETGQAHVAYILTGEGDCVPLSEEYRTKLKGCRQYLADHIESQHSTLISFLVSNDVITETERQRVEALRSTEHQKMNEALINLMMRKSQTSFEKFIAGLISTDQVHVAKELVGLDVVGEIILTWRPSRTSPDQETIPDTSVLEKLFRILRNVLKNASRIANKFIGFLKLRRINVADVRRGSLIITFRCRYCIVLTHLEYLVQSGKLDSVFNETFSYMFVDDGVESFRVNVLESEFQKCRENFKLQLMTPQHQQTLRASVDQLAGVIKVDAEFLDTLFIFGQRRQAIEQAQLQEAVSTGSLQIKILLDILSRRPDSAFRQFITGLWKTKQHTAASLLSKMYHETCIMEYTTLTVTPTDASEVTCSASKFIADPEVRDTSKSINKEQTNEATKRPSIALSSPTSSTSRGANEFMADPEILEKLDSRNKEQTNPAIKRPSIVSSSSSSSTASMSRGFRWFKRAKSSADGSVRNGSLRSSSEHLSAAVFMGCDYDQWHDQSLRYGSVSSGAVFSRGSPSYDMSMSFNRIRVGSSVNDRVHGHSEPTTSMYRSIDDGDDLTMSFREMSLNRKLDDKRDNKHSDTCQQS